MPLLDSFNCRKNLKVGSKTYVYYSLKAAEKNGLKGISKLPFSLKVLLENLLRFEDGKTVKKSDIQSTVKWLKSKGKDQLEIAFRPSRVLMQDFTGVPAVVDLAAMRDAIAGLGGDPAKINQLLATARARLVDNPPWLWIVHDLNPRAMSRRVTGFTSAQSWFQDLTTIDLR